MSDSELEQAIEAIQAGQKAQGLAILARVVNQEPHNERAWLWLATCVDEPERKRFCLQRVLEINPASTAGQQLLAELDAPAAPPLPPAPAENLFQPLASETESSTPAQPAQTADTSLPPTQEETPKPPRFGEWGVILMTGLQAGLVGVILAVPLEFIGLLARAKTTSLWAAYSVLWIGVGLIAGYLLRLRGMSNKVTRAVVGAPAGFITGFALGWVTAFVLNVIFKPNSLVVDSADSIIFNFISSALIYGISLGGIGMGLGVLGALIMIGILGAIDWAREPEATEDRYAGRKREAKIPTPKPQIPRTKDQGPRTKGQGQNSKPQ